MKRPEELQLLEKTALAVRYVLTAPEADRPDLAAALASGCGELVLTCKGIAERLEKGTVALPDLLAIEDPKLKPDRAALEAAGLLRLWEASEGWDREKDGRAAYETAAAFRSSHSLAARMVDALKRVDKARTAEDPAELEADLAAALHTLSGKDERADLSGLWEKHRAGLKAEACSDLEAVRLDERRGPWAGWVNSCLGPRAGLTPGRLLLLGGAPGAGKTALGSCFAVDALAAGCPVLFHQMELGVEETLEHLTAQDLEASGWPGAAFHDRANRALPEHWGRLLSIPSNPDPSGEGIVDAIQKQARTAERDRKRDRMKHACNGLVVIDYAQLITMKQRGAKDAGHEVIASAVSGIAKAAADCGAVVVLLSQLTKQAQQEGKGGSATAYAGADIGRMAHCALMLDRATMDGEKLKACKDHEPAGFAPGRGDLRKLTRTKERGFHTPDRRPPDRDCAAWVMNRAFHDLQTRAGGGLCYE